jgi:predicted dehydrogenase
MTERKARWAMWSLGNIANRVIVEMRESTEYDIVAVCSSHLDKAKDFIEKNGLQKAQAYDDIEEVLKRDDIDVVYVASPPWLHKEQCCKVMNAGKACLVEKPMTLNYQDAKDIFDCAKRNNVFCAEGIWTNYFPATKKMVEWIKSGRIGDPVEAISTFGFPMVELGADPTDTSHWGNSMKNGGGALSQFGCYDVNFAQTCFGAMPDGIYGKSDILPIEDGSDKNTMFVLTYKGGKQHALISCSWDARTISDSRISGTKGEVVIGRPFFAPFKAELLTHKDHFWSNDVEETFIDPYGETGREGFKYEFEAVSKYVVEGLKESPEVTQDYSLTLAATMERIRNVLGMKMK